MKEKNAHFALEFSVWFKIYIGTYMKKIYGGKTEKIDHQCFVKFSARKSLFKVLPTEFGL